MQPLIGICLTILFLPLISSVVLIFLNKRLPRGGDLLATACIGIPFCLAWYVFFHVIAGTHDPQFLVTATMQWFSIGTGNAAWGFHIDNLTVVMLVVVTTVSFCVHVYSIGYMHGEDYYGRYFSQLGLFSFSMLLLILCDNLLLLYISWELVGLSSYLLIGFFFRKHSAADACKKAFITTRVGDVGMLIGLLMIYQQTHTFNFIEVFRGIQEAVQSGAWSETTWTIAGILLFCGAIGKSAQLPLHVWLPDAMEGPTPVSALIHAATMVAAGVYLVGRLYPLFSPDALLFIAYIGLITAFFAATIAITQFDIKRVLAYSTISQLGYMMTALGVGGFAAGLCHLMTHAAFKAMLFLCSGSVIHAVHTQDMREMGGLHKKMPITFWTMLIGAAAISGVPLFSGFYSKDAILASALRFGMEHPNHRIIFVGLLVSAGITAFYMFRLIFMTFFGKPADRHQYEHAHESPRVMTIPLILLATLSVVAGWFALGEHGWFERFVLPYSTGIPVETVGGAYAEHGAHAAHSIAMILSILMAGLGILISAAFYYWKKCSAERWAKTLGPIYRLVYNKYYVDEIYEKTAVGGTLLTMRILAAFDRIVIDGLVNFSAYFTRAWSYISGVFDLHVVDGAVNFLAWGTRLVGTISTFFQSGMVQNYVMKVIAIVAFILLFQNIVTKFL